MESSLRQETCLKLRETDKILFNFKDSMAQIVLKRPPAENID